jgi:hypothetical protein
LLETREAAADFGQHLLRIAVLVEYPKPEINTVGEGAATARKLWEWDRLLRGARTPNTKSWFTN